MRRLPFNAVLVVLVLSATARLGAQGTLSTQGLGFPPGQLSTPAKAMGGAVGEIDPMSPLNPAAIGLVTSALLLFQAEPEYRKLRVGNETVATTISRFPLFLGGLPLGSKWALGVSVSTLVDRTFETVTRDSQLVSGDSIFSTVRERSEGSISDIRLAVSYAPWTWMKIGIGGHALSGNDVLITTRIFDDTIRFATDAQRTTVGFGGNAVSAGFLTLFPRRGALGVSYRRGGSIRAYDADDNVVGSGAAPDHFGASLVYLGIRGTALAVRAAKDNWSRLEGMAQTLNIHEGWDIGAGVDVTGPRFSSGSAIGLRAGGRWRTLPFSVDGSPVDEQTWSGGFVMPIGRTRAVEWSMGVLRATRSHAPLGTGVPVGEKSWTLSTGFAVRP